MKNRGRSLSLIIIFIVMLSGMMGKLAMGNDSTTRLHELVQGLPETLEEWSKSSDFAVYDAENLYVYINGGAELYISYQFINLISQPYVNEEDDEIKIDIFDMGSSQSAYGIFSHSRETIDNFVGSNIESEYAGGLLTFWKGRYYVSILAYPETESRKLVVQQLARKIAAQVQEDSYRPKILALLPEYKIQPHSIRYFKHFTWMNMYHFFSNKNLLNIDNETEVVMAKYTVGTSKHTVLILLQYPSEAAAEIAHNTFKNTFMANAKDEYTKGVDQLWTGCIRDKNLVVIVVDAPNLETAQKLVKNID
ncbi:MAG: hypothetical protein HKP41_11520 [Desulfobacterales bacterium]|nr:hypothetical protein [Desulfobacterales bacterium]